jgi:hypothetical protein
MPCNNTSGSCAPDMPMLRLKMKNGTPLMPALRASLSAPAIRLRRIICEHGIVGQVCTLDEIGTEQRLRHRILLAESAGMVQQAVRLDGVGLHADFFKLHVETDGLADIGHALVTAVILVAKFLPDVFEARNAGFRQVGIQLEGQPAHGWRCFIGIQFSELFQREFQLALADETPGSNHVGNDIDAEARVHGCSCGWLNDRYITSI